MKFKQKKSILLSKYEKIVNYSSSLFDREDWRAFDDFCLGYKLALEELNKN